MFAKVFTLRTLGGLDNKATPTDPAEWQSGLLEFSTAASEGAGQVPRRLVLRHAKANPSKGVLLELYRPELIEVRHPYVRVRGIEPTPTESGAVGAMVQEWLIVIGYQAGPDGRAPF